MFAVIELQGHQYIVREGDTIVVDKLELDSASYVADKVLLIAEEDWSSTVVGKPYVANMAVHFDVVTDFQKGEKVRVLKFKRKTRYQRVIGFRPFQTVLQVTSIGQGGSKPKAAKKTDSSLNTEWRAEAAAPAVEVTESKSAKKETAEKPAKEAKPAKEEKEKPAKKVAAEKPAKEAKPAAKKAPAKPKAKPAKE